MSKRELLGDWEQRLFTFLNGVRSQGVEWGQFDCAVGLVAGAVKAQTGADLAVSHIGKYGDQKEALRYMRDNQWDTPEALMDSFLNKAEKTRRGNIVLLSQDNWTGFGIRVGAKALAFGPNHGLREFSIIEGSPEWKVT